jgi:hypothetical protein
VGEADAAGRYDDADVRELAAGVCGTDREIADGNY